MRILFNGARVAEFIENAFIGSVNACRERVGVLVADTVRELH